VNGGGEKQKRKSLKKRLKRGKSSHSGCKLEKGKKDSGGDQQSTTCVRMKKSTPFPAHHGTKRGGKRLQKKKRGKRPWRQPVQREKANPVSRNGYFVH